MLLCRLDLNSFLNAHDFRHSWGMTMRDRLRIDLEWVLKPGLVVFLKATLWIFPHFSSESFPPVVLLWRKGGVHFSTCQGKERGNDFPHPFLSLCQCFGARSYLVFSRSSTLAERWFSQEIPFSQDCLLCWLPEFLASNWVQRCHFFHFLSVFWHTFNRHCCCVLLPWWFMLYLHVLLCPRAETILILDVTRKLPFTLITFFWRFFSVRLSNLLPFLGGWEGRNNGNFGSCK